MPLPKQAQMLKRLERELGGKRARKGLWSVGVQ